jgi:DNA-binding transcriptional ArsR family regulator
MDEQAPRILPHRELDLESLRGLAHPLRVQLLDTLSTYGSFTASGLAERLGESSGATSYHLRQLEKHGFVREVEGKGSGRERWWERVPGGIEVGTGDVIKTPAGRAASSIVLHQWQANRDRLLADYVDRGPDELSDEWTDPSRVSTVNLRLTSDQLAEVAALFDEAMLKLDAYRGRNLPGSRPVQVQLNVFPVVDGDVTPGPENVGG